MSLPPLNMCKQLELLSLEAKREVALKTNYIGPFLDYNFLLCKTFTHHAFTIICDIAIASAHSADECFRAGGHQHHFRPRNPATDDAYHACFTIPHHSGTNPSLKPHVISSNRSYLSLTPSPLTPLPSTRAIRATILSISGQPKP